MSVLLPNSLLDSVEAWRTKVEENRYPWAIMHFIMYTVYVLGPDSTEIVIHHDELNTSRSSDFTPGCICSAKTRTHQWPRGCGSFYLHE